MRVRNGFTKCEKRRDSERVVENQLEAILFRIRGQQSSRVDLQHSCVSSSGPRASGFVQTAWPTLINVEFLPLCHIDSGLQKDRRILKKTEPDFFVYSVTYKQRFLGPESDRDLTFEISALQHMSPAVHSRTRGARTPPHTVVYSCVTALQTKRRAPVGLQRQCVVSLDGRMASCTDDAAERRRKRGRESANISKFRSPSDSGLKNLCLYVTA